MKLIKFVLASAAIALGLATQAGAQRINTRAELDALLGANQVLEDFESFDVAVGDAVNLDVFSLDHNSIVNGQGPNLVEPGAAYSDPSQIQLQWNGDQYFGLNTKTILSNGNSGDIRISFSPLVQAMGIDTRAYQGFPYDGFFDVYAGGGGLLDSIAFSLIGGGAENVFLGYRHDAGIGAVVIRSDNYHWSPLIDNNGYGNLIPEPGTLAAVALGLLTLRRARRKS